MQNEALILLFGTDSNRIIHQEKVERIKGVFGAF